MSPTFLKEKGYTVDTYLNTQGAWMISFNKTLFHPYKWETISE